MPEPHYRRGASTPPSERIAQVRSLFAAALAQPAECRDQWLRGTDAVSETVIEEVRALVNHCERSHDPLEEGIEVPASLNDMLGNCQLREVGEQIGKFEIKRLLGVGGFGAVYLCRDPLLKREVAVKIPHATAVTSEQDFDRQLAEAQRVAALDCAGIVPVLEGNRTTDGCPFFVMQYIAGSSLDQRLRGERLDPFEGAALLAKIADILAIVHARGIVHRDLKPSNILLSPDGRPFVADFGLASSVTSNTDDPCRVAGTPAYMAPEQFDAEQSVDGRADVWSLGVILHELLTGRRPFTDGNVAELRASVLETKSVDFEWRDRHSPAGLRRICQKCLQKSPADRYQSASEVASALWRQCPRRMRPAVRRSKFAALIGGAVLAVTALSVGGSLVLVDRARSQLSVSQQQSLDRDRRLRQTRYLSEMVRAYQAWDKGRFSTVRAILERYRPREGEVDARGFEWRLLESLSRQPESYVLKGHEGAVDELALFADGRRVASVGEDGTLRIWDVPARKQIAAIDFGTALENIDLAAGGLHSVAVSPNGRYVVAGADVVGLVDLQGDATVRELFRNAYNVDSLAFSADGQRIAAGTRYEDVCLLNLDGEVLARVPCDSRAETLTYLPQRQQWLVPNVRDPQALDYQGEYLQVWDDHFDRIVRELDTTSELGYTDIKFARVVPGCRDAVAASSLTPRLYVLSLESGKVLEIRDDFRSRLTDFAFSPDGSVLAIAQVDGNICYLPWASDKHGKRSLGAQLQTIVAHQGRCHSIRFLSADTLLTGGDDGLKVWDLRQFQKHVEVHLAANVFSDPEYSADGQRLVLGSSAPGVVWIVESMTGEASSSIPCSDAGAGTALSPSGGEIAVIRREGRSVTVFAANGRELCTIAHPDGVWDVAFSPDGSTVASIGHVLRISDSESGELLYERRLPGKANVIAFSHVGDWIGYGGEFGRVQTLNLENPEQCQDLSCDSDTACIAFSRDDEFFATGHDDAVVRLWNRTTDTPVAELVGHEHRVISVCFAPDGRSLLSMDGRTLRIWSLDEQRLLGTVLRRPGLSSIAISPDGRQIVLSANEADASDPEMPNLIFWNVDDIP